ncbi:MAG: nucleotidyltransferase family protein [Sphingomonadales bacterium]|nr:nucleotidyltransferase family protein [Sphingomonadales bacterium]
MRQFPNDVPIVIVAGGNASRMGASKPTQIVDGNMLLSRVLNTRAVTVPMSRSLCAPQIKLAESSRTI